MSAKMESHSNTSTGCDRCQGEGWYIVDNEPVFCDCEAGPQREAQFHEALARRARTTKRRRPVAHDYKAEAAGEGGEG